MGVRARNPLCRQPPRTGHHRQLAGTFIIPQGKPLRIVLQFTRDDSGTRKATFYSIDQGTERFRADSITMQDPTVKLVLRFVQGSCEGKLSADGNSITGVCIQGSPLPLISQNATKATAWPLNASPHTVQFATIEPGVKLEVLDWGGTGHVFDNLAPSCGEQHRAVSNIERTIILC
jgi:hypothetical protein